MAPPNTAIAANRGSGLCCSATIDHHGCAAPRRRTEDSRILGVHYSHQRWTCFGERRRRVTKARSMASQGLDQTCNRAARLTITLSAPVRGPKGPTRLRPTRSCWAFPSLLYRPAPLGTCRSFARRSWGRGIPVYRRAPVSTKSTCLLPHCEHLSRSTQSRTESSAPWRVAC